MMRKAPFLVIWLLLVTVPRAKDSLSIAVIEVGWQTDYTWTALHKKGETCSLLTAKTLADTSRRFTGYDILIVNEWWTQDTREVLNTHQDRLREFVRQGGVLIVMFSLNNPCDYQYWTSSWSAYPMYVTLNNSENDCRKKAHLLNDEIELEGHPIFAGFKDKFLKVGDRKAFKTNDPRWYVLLKNRDHEQPTLMECNYEKGKYLVTGPELSYWYGKKVQQTLLFDNLLAYAKSIAYQTKAEREAVRKKALADSLQAAAAAHPPASSVPPPSGPVYQEPAPVAEPVYNEMPAAEPASPEPAAGPRGGAEAIPGNAGSPGYELIPLKMANNWVFNNGHVWSITGDKNILDKQVFSLTFSSGLGSYYLGSVADGIYLYGTTEGGVDNIVSTPQLMFKYPANVGDRYQAAISIGGGEASVTVTGTASQVETEIGTFSCYEYSVERGGQQQVWYLCPEIGFVKLKNQGEEIILNDYMLN